MRDLRLLPKAHLHVHLESTVRPQTVREWGGPPEPEGPFASFREFADQRARVRELLCTPERFRRVALEFCQDEAAQGTRYAEVTFTAASHGERVGALEMPLEAVLDGLAEGRRYGIECRVLLDHSRRRPVERLWRTLKLATRYDEVIGIGLAGDESHPLAPFAEVLDAARDAGLHLVHHAGESAGPAGIREALDLGHGERLGHGIRVLDDPALVAEVRERGVPLEVCPTSNVLLGLVPTLAAHPLPRLREAGLVVTINTDGETALADEYARLRDVFGFTDADLAELAAAGAGASFAPPAVKEQITAGVTAWLGHP
ncbi:adenosine deaminase [Streptosporangium becharense]|uniref:Adenosine deaminase n=1 Tax=Streptosporangium becharense TaxID=1816182 RepID=A0A7W9MEP5_9ACTN|nr:adenosine deaminase [Streptosporangium becharense]MBB2910758.1 adenosine deaminase [Streptosporangium becharense]MBB5817453.1 adenosine deaminase [Streptosporangium becharense]